MKLARGLILLIAMAAAACNSPYYKGIDLRAGMAPTDVQALARRAHAGDKEAQYMLGRRFEAGGGVGQDLEQAEALYREAANDKGGTKWIYVPQSGPVGARIEQFENPTTYGSASADERLSGPQSSENTAENQDDVLHGKDLTKKPLDELATSEFALDRKVAVLASQSPHQSAPHTTSMSCALLIAGAHRPVELLKAACPEGQRRMATELRPQSIDLKNGYYLRCKSNRSLLEQLLPTNSDDSSFPTGGDPLLWDRSAIEFISLDDTVHIDFGGPVRCATRVIIISPKGG